MDRVEEIRTWAFNEAKQQLPATTSIEQIIDEAKKLEAYIDVNVNADPKTWPGAKE